MGQLRDQMDGDLRLKGFRPVTRYHYLRCARSFAAHYRKSPAVLGEAEVRALLLHLIDERQAKPATVRMYVAALKFLYAITLRRPEVVARIPWPQVPEHLPDILTPAEIVQLLHAVHSLKHRVVLMIAYGAGLRISEGCSLEIGDIDSQRMVIHVRDGKGGKDRYVMLSERLLAVRPEYWRLTKPQGSFLFPTVAGRGRGLQFAKHAGELGRVDDTCSVASVRCRELAGLEITVDRCPRYAGRVGCCYHPNFCHRRTSVAACCSNGPCMRRDGPPSGRNFFTTSSGSGITDI